MSRRNHEPAAGGEDTDYSTRPAHELAELLRNVLLSVRDATPAPPPVPPLGTEAQAAVAQFRAISDDLAVATVFAPATGIGGA